MRNDGRYLVLVGAGAPAGDAKSPWWAIGILCAIAGAIYALCITPRVRP